MKTVKKSLLILLCLLLAATMTSAQLARPVVGQNVEYVAKEGDTLLSIALAHRLAIEHLAHANGYPTSAVHIIPGTRLQIPGERVLPLAPPADGLVLNVPERAIYRYRAGKFVELVPVAVGNYPEGKTPIGTFSIIEKIKDPTWYPPSWADVKGPVAPGPNNPLGDRWIGLSAPLVGIHGTNNSINVGGTVTRGCIRCYPEHVRDLFEKVRVGDTVRIDYEVAKLGKREDGSLLLVTFEDVYKKDPPLEAARRVLSKIGKESLLNDPNFAGRVKLHLGTGIDLNQAETLAVRRKQAQL